ncbi:hypothetical protein [Coleofasciculus sp. FACHB-1120]|uniref:hypothetical protein n=1 Tax=Coleofasciculus sp. FACHB-1120 TaxID=2692783 RepID=UPI001683694C|nr:hypothetical protein [Coleofasciculus sp. FACHB-1120]MBD2742403.1 hypothetical protein [Coleofasciculus sp. FACHB-1120]
MIKDTVEKYNVSQKQDIYLLDEATLNALTGYWRENCLKEGNIDYYGFLVSMRDAFKLVSECCGGRSSQDKWFWILHEFMQDEYNKMTIYQFNLDKK